MTSAAHEKVPTMRIAVPTLLDGAYRSALICTYGAQLEFYEEVLRRQLASCRNQIILADAIRLGASVAAAAAGGHLRHINRTYVAAPIAHGHAAHAKLILLTGPDAGMLLIGSGNLSYSGYAGAGECFTAYPWSPENQTYLREFQTARRFIDALGEREMLDSFARSRVERMWATTEWIHRAAPAGESLVRHNLDAPLAQQFIAAVGGEAVEELVVAAPFYDSSVTALRRLRDAFAPDYTTVLVQPKRTSVDADALAAALADGGDSSVHPIAGPGDPYLHAKLFIVRTATRAVCLAGSANCSTVALFDAHPGANVEIGVLLAGARAAFDHLLGDITISAAADPHTLELTMSDDTDDEDIPTPPWTLTNVIWRPPILRGVVQPAVPTEAIVRLVVGELALDDVTVKLTDHPDGQRFEAHVEGDASALIDTVIGISLSVHLDGEPPQRSAIAVAYQATVLEAMDARRFDAERLRGAAALELDDPELATLLAELEQLLITDGRSAWRMAHIDPPPPEDDGDGPAFPWDAIDWSLVHQHPRYVSYQQLQNSTDAAPGELAAYLDALSSALRELIEPDEAEPPPAPLPPGPGDTEPDDEEPSDGTKSQDSDAFDKGEDQIERHRQSAKARNLRLIRNFVRRNLRALESPGFRTGVGPGVVVPNAVVLDHICWRTVTRHEDSFGELLDERLRLWTCLWGVESGPAGYLATLDDEDQLALLELLAKHHVEALLLASMYDAYSAMTYDSESFGRLRSVQRRILVHPLWQPSARTPQDAAALVNARSVVAQTVDGRDIAGAVYDTVARTDTKEVRATIAGIAGASELDVDFEKVIVSIDGTAAGTKVVQATIRNTERMDSATAEHILGAWSLLEELPVYRVRCGSVVASYRAATGTGTWYDRDTDDEVIIGELDPDWPAWLTEANALLDTAESTVTAKAS